MVGRSRAVFAGPGSRESSEHRGGTRCAVHASMSNSPTNPWSAPWGLLLDRSLLDGSTRPGVGPQAILRAYRARVAEMARLAPRRRPRAERIADAEARCAQRARVRAVEEPRRRGRLAAAHRAPPRWRGMIDLIVDFEETGVPIAVLAREIGYSVGWTRVIVRRLREEGEIPPRRSDRPW